MAYVEIPKDLKEIKTKLVAGLTKRQAIGFGFAGVIATTTYFFVKKVLPDEIALIIFMVVASPFVLFAVYQKDGMPAEEVFKSWLKFKYLNPPTRTYQTTRRNKSLERGLTKRVRKPTNKTTARRVEQVNSKT